MVKNPFSSAAALLFFSFLFIAAQAQQEVSIGSQIWMKKNSDAERYRNGDPIPQAKTQEEWFKAGEDKKPVWCYYNNDPALGDTYGKLYNWYAASDRRGLCPDGWSIPSNSDWKDLTEFLGGTRSAGAKMKTQGDTYWETPNEGALNDTGFSALGAGMRTPDSGFTGKGAETGWWSSSTTMPLHMAWVRKLHYLSASMAVSEYHKGYGLSVRCIKD